MTQQITDDRLEELLTWLRADVGIHEFTIRPASSDASFRRYFRIAHEGQTHIVMDAPPEKENIRPFVAVARTLAGAGLNVPHIHQEDFERGFLLLTDLGNKLYLNMLNEANADRLYGEAMQALHIMQAVPVDSHTLPPYDRTLLMAEMALFRDWFLRRHLGVTQGLDELDRIFELLAESALEQPRVWVHRDYHSRNLMFVDADNPGILDFQDAVAGPVTYDLVSLLRDCYISWPQSKVEQWVRNYHIRARQTGSMSDVDAEQFLRWFDLMGVQRHLKAIGIFARLNLRDGKPGYLQDIPRTLGYVTAVSARYPELTALSDLVQTKVMTRMQQIVNP